MPAQPVNSPPKKRLRIAAEPKKKNTDPRAKTIKNPNNNFPVKTLETPSNALPMYMYRKRRKRNNARVKNPDFLPPIARNRSIARPPAHWFKWRYVVRERRRE
jgi:hypothetical protein